MSNWQSIIAGVLCGIVFESILSSPYKGFYLVPVVLISVVYSVLPFTVKLLNIGIAWLSGIMCILILALVVSGGHIISFNYFMHIMIIITFCTVIIYASASKK